MERFNCGCCIDLWRERGWIVIYEALQKCYLICIVDTLRTCGLEGIVSMEARSTTENKKRPAFGGASHACKQTFVQRGECLGASHLLGLKAAGAHVHLATHAVDDNVHALDVRTELTVGDAVGVADGATSNGVLTADFANFGHVSDPS